MPCMHMCTCVVTQVCRKNFQLTSVHNKKAAPSLRLLGQNLTIIQLGTVCRQTVPSQLYDGTCLPVPVFCELCPKVFRFPAASLFICVPKCSVFLQRPYLFVSQSVPIFCSVPIYVCVVKIRRNVMRFLPCKVLQFSAASLFICVPKCSVFLQRPCLCVCCQDTQECAAPFSLVSCCCK